MNDRRDPISDEQLENYLDGMYSGADLERFETRLANDRRAQRLVDAQHQFDARLRKSFLPPDRTIEQIENWLCEPVTVPISPPTSRRPMFIVLAVIAAAMAWLVVGIQWHDGRRIEPFFEQRSLAVIYQETVTHGFRPYYFCEDEQRFALTFRKRQNVPLVLEKTPGDRRMVGLSYLGGLSRDTTSVLCFVGETPVIVFVDRATTDNPGLAMDAGDSQLHVHRSELGSLVLYEVSPLATPKMADFLKIAR